ncbi:hypothetical protein [Curtobacterium sp. RIT-PI-V]|jgi:hypothetical protein|uniref:hypothetical protein n=1 Tax=Curtobacterium sp. RIT-PI-V TaxID=3035296 RepID=UPI0021D7AC97|nr:hypothetical protein [Curtobacterium sp. RIT-PI-V]
MTDQSEAASTPLALTSVVASGLPTELGKPTAAAKYDDVPAEQSHSAPEPPRVSAV